MLQNSRPPFDIAFDLSGSVPTSLLPYQVDYAQVPFPSNRVHLKALVAHTAGDSGLSFKIFLRVWAALTVDSSSKASAILGVPYLLSSRSPCFRQCAYRRAGHSAEDCLRVGPTLPGERRTLLLRRQPLIRPLRKTSGPVK